MRVPLADRPSAGRGRTSKRTDTIGPGASLPPPGPTDPNTAARGPFPAPAAASWNWSFRRRTPIGVGTFPPATRTRGARMTAPQMPDLPGLPAADERWPWADEPLPPDPVLADEEEGDLDEEDDEDL